MMEFARFIVPLDRMGKYMSIIVVGIDLAKTMFAAHGVGKTGKAQRVKPRVSRDLLAALISSLPPCIIGMSFLAEPTDQWEGSPQVARAAAGQLPRERCQSNIATERSLR